jgi:hypothetical protein
MIPLCFWFDFVLFTPKMPAAASYGNFSSHLQNSVAGMDVSQLQRYSKK